MWNCRKIQNAKIDKKSAKNLAIDKINKNDEILIANFL